MKSLEELKKEVFYKLSKHPKIEAFFKDSLEERMKIDDNWTENALVLRLLDDEFFKQSALHTLIAPLYNDHENFNTLRSKLNPRDEYDKKIRDVLAELNGYYHLVKSDFEKIEALPEDDQQMKPDFFAQLNAESYLFEVKNMRAPIEVCDLLLTKTKARGHRFPEVYKTNAISFRVSEKWREIEFNRQETRDIGEEVEKWLQETFAKIESAEGPMHFTKGDLIIECLLRKGKQIGPSCGYRRGVMVSDPIYKQSILSPFAKKVSRIVSDASQQLLDYDKNNLWKKYVLLNWGKSYKYEVCVWDGFEDDAYGIVKRIDIEIKNNSESLFVRLLNSDSLP